MIELAQEILALCGAIAPLIMIYAAFEARREVRERNREIERQWEGTNGTNGRGEEGKG